MRFVVLYAVIAVAASGCVGPQVAQLGQLPMLEEKTAPEAAGTPSIAARTLAAIAIERVTRNPARSFSLLENPTTAKKRAF